MKLHNLLFITTLIASPFVLSNPVQALTTTYTLDVPSLTIQECTKVSGGCPATTPGVIDFSLITFDYTVPPTPGTIDNVSNATFGYSSGIKAPETFWSSFTSGTYNSTNSTLTFTGSTGSWGNGSNLVQAPTTLTVALSAPLADLGGNANITASQVLFFESYCAKWSNEGNSNCLAEDLATFVPFNVSFLALAPLSLVGALRKRYTTK